MAFKPNRFQKLRVYDGVGVTLRVQDGGGAGRGRPCRDLSNHLKPSHCLWSTEEMIKLALKSSDGVRRALSLLVVDIDR